MAEILSGPFAGITCIECGSTMQRPRTLSGGSDPLQSRVAMDCSNDDCALVVHIYAAPTQFAVWPHRCPHGMTPGTYIEQLRAAATREAINAHKTAAD